MLFVSERDRLPLCIRYGVDPRVRGPALPMVFEQKGRQGRRQVGFIGGIMEEVDGAAYESLWNGDSRRSSNAEPPLRAVIAFTPRFTMPGDSEAPKWCVR
jgi:hypothetical protein